MSARTSSALRVVSGRPPSAPPRPPAARARPPAAPGHLSATSKAFWRRIMKEWDLEAHAELLLLKLCEAIDQGDAAQAIVDREGMTLPGRWGSRAHPMLAVVRDCRIAVARLTRELGLDLEAPATSRPPSRWRGQ